MMARLSPRVLNRTLLHRQHLLSRCPGNRAPTELVRHLVGLQAQDPLPPYLGLAARLDHFDPRQITDALEDRSLVRLLAIRGTVHLLTSEDALSLRPWAQRHIDGEERQAQNIGAASQIAREAFSAALTEALAEGPLSQSALGLALAERWPGHDATQLGRRARVRAPLAQLPPRGCWKRSGAVVYEDVERWLGSELVAPDEVDVATLAKRYFAAYGPATAADLTTWSGVTRLGPVVRAMADRDELVLHRDENGKPLYDVPGGEVVDAATPAPVRLLGVYDNLWLSHARRDRVTDPPKRRAWMGANGGVASAVFVDGMLEGLWRVEDRRVRVLETFRALTSREQSELDDEISRVDALMAVPAR